MKIIQFYIFSELIKKIFIMTAGFTLLVTFFNFINELDSISNNTFTLRNIFFIQALKLSTVIYEVLPIGTLIGGLWAFATIAATSEFIAMRVGGFTPYLIFKIICIAWIPLLVVSLFLSELLMPLSNKLLGKNQSLNQSSSSVSEFKSGYWLRDRVGESTAENKEFLPNTERIVNFSSIDIKKMIKFITIFEFNQNNILTRRISAESAGYFAANDNFFDAPDNFRGYWKLINPKVIILSKDGNVLVSEPAQITLHTKLSVETIDALTIHPEKMSLYNLKNFINYLKDGNQKVDNFEILLWKRVFYPLVMLTMLLIALPAAYIKTRSGSIGLKLFVGVLIGTGFHLLNGLFSHLGLINTWSPLLIALLPSLSVLLICLFLLFFVQKIKFF